MYVEESLEVTEESVYHQAGFRKVEELEQYGISKSDITKLKAGGYHTIEAVRVFIL